MLKETLLRNLCVIYHCVLYCRYLQEDFIKEDIRDEIIQCFVINLKDESDSSSNEIENEI